MNKESNTPKLTKHQEFMKAAHQSGLDSWEKNNWYKQMRVPNYIYGGKIWKRRRWTQKYEPI